MNGPAASDAERAALERGLDVLELARAHKTPLVLRAGPWLLPKIGGVLVLLGLWGLISLFKLEPQWHRPIAAGLNAHTVGQTWRTGGYLNAVGNTLWHALSGYLVSLVFGTVVGVGLARVRPFRIAFGSLVVALQSMPSVVWIFFALLIFGPTVTAVYVVVLMGAFPSIAAGTVAALDHVPPLLTTVGRSMGARGFALYRYVVFPAAMPGFLSGMKQAWSFSWRSLMAAELIGGVQVGLGLGTLVTVGYQTSDMTLLMAATFGILLVGLAVEELFFAPLDRLIRTRRGLATAA